GGCSPIEVAEDADLQLETLGHRLDHEIDGGSVLERAREREARQRGVGLFTRELAPLDAPLQSVAPRRDVLPTGLERTGVDVVADRLVPGRRRHLRDPAAHHTRSEYAD